MIWFKRTVTITKTTEGGISFLPVVIVILAVMFGSGIMAAIASLIAVMVEVLVIIAWVLGITISLGIVTAATVIGYKVSEKFGIHERAGNAIIERVKARQLARGKGEMAAIEPTKVLTPTQYKLYANSTYGKGMNGSNV